MINNLSVLSIIPARGGSKGIPKKNVIEFCGKPLVAWTIEQALSSQYIDSVVVTTDDMEIARVSKSFGAEVPFLRPKEIAQDQSQIYESVIHCLDYFKENNKEFDLIVLLEPTSPLRDVYDMDKAIEKICMTNDIKSIVSVCLLGGTHPEYLVTLSKEKNFIRKYYGDKMGKLRRQEFYEVYYIVGCFAIFYPEYYRRNLGLYNSKTAGYPVSRYQSVDIDEKFDLIIGEAVIKYILDGRKSELK